MLKQLFFKILGSYVKVAPNISNFFSELHDKKIGEALLH